ncbi:MAG: type II toxin-antitoxin system HicB family antitoxin [Acidimicrobiales bacterium]
MPETITTPATTKYHATFTLDPSGQWLVELDELSQVHTFGRTLGKAREYLLDALALWLNEPVATVKDRVIFRPPALPEEIERTVEMALAEREIAEAATRVAAELTQQASIQLVTDARMSMRDAADILGLSHQRVQQLVANPERPQPPQVDPLSELVDKIAKAVREFLPGGSKEEVGLAIALAGGAILLSQRR